MKNRLNQLWIIVLLFSALSGCVKDNTEAELLSIDLIDQVCDVTISPANAAVNIVFPNEVTSAEKLQVEFAVSKGASSLSNGEILTSGHSKLNFEAPFIFKVLAEDGLNQSNYEISTFNNDYTSGWGLGGFQKSSVSNNRDYNWYLDQSVTGKYSGVNCGPTSTTMAAKWANNTFAKTPEDARSAYRPEGGWWYTSDIDAYLTNNNIQHYFINLGNSIAGSGEIMLDQLNDGNILILCLDMYYISNGTDLTWHVDKFYSTNAEDWGHFIVVKGYKVVDGQLFIECYDPYCYNKKYNDGGFKGKDRYYRNNDLYKATSIWWNYAIVISGDGEKYMPVNALDKADIPNQGGR